MKKLFAALVVWCALVCPALAAFSILDEGQNNCSSCTTLAITTTNTPFNSADIVIVIINDFINTTCGTLSDGTHSYTNLSGASAARAGGSGAGCIYYFQYGSSASPTTLTYTAPGSSFLEGTAAKIAGGASSSPIDAAVTNVSTTSCISCSVTSGSPSVSGEFFIGAYIAAAGNSTIGGGFVVPPDSTSSGDTIGGHLLNSGTGTETFTAMSSSTNGVVMSIFAITPPGGGATTIYNRDFMGVGN